MNYVRPALPLVAIVSLLLLVSCTADEEQAPNSGGQPAVSADSHSDVELPDDIRNRILSNLEALSGADPNSVSIEGVQPTTWPDGCLGLADPGLCELSSRQTAGFVVTLEAFGHKILYHATESTVLYVGPEDARELVLEDLRRQLSETAKISADEIKIGRVQSAVWKNSCLGLRGQGMCIPPIGPRAGFKVWLILRGKEYVFHVDTTGHYDARCLEEAGCNSPNTSPSGPTGVP